MHSPFPSFSSLFFSLFLPILQIIFFVLFFCSSLSLFPSSSLLSVPMGVWTGSQRLMEIADEITEVKVTCLYCNKKATVNMKLIDGKPTFSGPQVQLGCEETYVPVCYRHFREKTAPQSFAINPALLKRQQQKGSEGSFLMGEECDDAAAEVEALKSSVYTPSRGVMVSASSEEEDEDAMLEDLDTSVSSGCGGSEDDDPWLLR